MKESKVITRTGKKTYKIKIFLKYKWRSAQISLQKKKLLLWNIISTLINKKLDWPLKKAPELIWQRYWYLVVHCLNLTLSWQGLIGGWSTSVRFDWVQVWLDAVVIVDCEWHIFANNGHWDVLINGNLRRHYLDSNPRTIIWCHIFAPITIGIFPSSHK